MTMTSNGFGAALGVNYRAYDRFGSDNTGSALAADATVVKTLYPC